MKQIKELIQLVDGWESKTVGQITSALNTPSVEVRDDSMYTWAGIALLIGPEGAEGLRVALESNGMGWVVHQLGGSGIQLSNPMVQGAMTLFGNSLPGATTLKEAGIKTVSIWTADGRSGSATNADVQAGLNALEHDNRKATLKQAGAARWNAYAAACDALQPGDGDPVL